MQLLAPIRVLGACSHKSVGRRMEVHLVSQCRLVAWAAIYNSHSKLDQPVGRFGHFRTRSIKPSCWPAQRARAITHR